MAKVGRNDPCPCGSGMKFKKCCLDKKPRQQIVMVGSPEPLSGFYYDHEQMELVGLAADGRAIQPAVTYSQTQYEGQSGKEKVIARIQDKVIRDTAALMRCLSSSFDLIIGIDTNTKTINGEKVSVSAVIHCEVQKHPESTKPTSYYVNFPWNGVIVFRNCPEDLPAEKFGWLALIQGFMRDRQNVSKRVAFVTDHDLDNHIRFNDRKTPIFKNAYLPDNFTMMYGRSDGSNENLLNHVVKLCDKKSTDVLIELERAGCFQYGEMKIPIDRIPVPAL
jgi:hypothetical protein